MERRTTDLLNDKAATATSMLTSRPACGRFCGATPRPTIMP